MITRLGGATLVLPDRLLPGGVLIVEGDRILAIEEGSSSGAGGDADVELSGCLIVPGFIDVHVHGVEGHDVLDGAAAVHEIAARLPRYGVTAFCPTAVACTPTDLEALLAAVAVARRGAPAGVPSARVVAAHLESNFINPDYRGAQPPSCLRTPAADPQGDPDDFAAADILGVVDAHRRDVAIVTLAPELPGGLALVRTLADAGIIVSIGHSGATYEQALEAVEAGARHATHLFNRMTPMSHRVPGVVGAVLDSERVTAELICDGFHVHPMLLRLAIRAKGVSRVVAITDGTAGSGLPVGSTTRLGRQSIVVTERTAELADGTLAGSVLTMDGAFRTLMQTVGMSPVEAAALCATTPAASLGLGDTGRLAPGYAADFVVLGPALEVRETFLRGQRWRNTTGNAFV